MKRLLPAILLGFFSITGFAQSNQEAAIRQILEKQTEAWNKGDLNAFMQTYWKSDSWFLLGRTALPTVGSIHSTITGKAIPTRQLWAGCSLRSSGSSFYQTRSIT
ncbi:hypothetical protein LWM68_41645 [Niabella sp. W65]|nr:hypothetical protein [Niabella sp. W65]MCH7368672.1 hypothetical protein [Niabella sp. W65]ULT44249.1 hypothetical protein KRR40_13345 [Niabella sp. I65]